MDRCPPAPTFSLPHLSCGAGARQHLELGHVCTWAAAKSQRVRDYNKGFFTRKNSPSRDPDHRSVIGARAYSAGQTQGATWEMLPAAWMRTGIKAAWQYERTQKAPWSALSLLPQVTPTPCHPCRAASIVRLLQALKCTCGDRGHRSAAGARVSRPIQRPNRRKQTRHGLLAGQSCGKKVPTS